MYVLGIGDVSHDQSVCLIKEGKIHAAIELERLSRIKHNVLHAPKSHMIDGMGEYFEELKQRLPVKTREDCFKFAIDYCLETAGIKANQIAYTFISSLFEHPIFPYNSVFINHHQAHAASAFYPSPFNEAAVLTLDAYGNFLRPNILEVGTWGVGENNQLEIICHHEGLLTTNKLEEQSEIISCSNSLGAFYKNITVLSGMGYFGEGKTMGLSSYGESNLTFSPLRDYVELLENGGYKIDNLGIIAFAKPIIEDGSRTVNPKQFFQLRANLAYSGQLIFEEIIFHICQALYEKTQMKNLCFAGGCALNSALNGKIIKNTPFNNLFMQPAPGDNGIALGCAYYGDNMLNPTLRKTTEKSYFSPYLGKTYSAVESKEILKLKSSDLAIIPTNAIIKTTAKLISEGKVIAWYNGKSEIGPRALGNRSILADPRNSKMQDYINHEIKHRESFRPFAPVILEEDVRDYFEIETPSPYMLQVVQVKSAIKHLIPAVVHYDNSARLQTIRRDQNPLYYDLIKAFKELTGIPILLNTSFNGKNEPIVETPEDAVNCFLKLGLDGLVLGGELMVHKNSHSSTNQILRQFEFSETRV